ncbi:MAG: dynamin family protein [Zoogloeaceae bacterium]|nr:dynamin family protein [Zoogloeaceae bacterium]
MSLVQHFATYSQWRTHVRKVITVFQHWLVQEDLNAEEARARLRPLRERLYTDHLHIAFVAEFSRGKSELINSIFFPDYGCRILPSSVGRTTMCPTELRYNPDQPSAIALLPSETRISGKTLGEYRRLPEAWTRTPLQMDSASAMQTALRQVSETIRVAPEESLRLGFSGSTADSAARRDEDGKVEIPRWRHALINFPHPLLKEGLVILDTPGLNAIGAEPELTLSLLPRAHAILFLLAADAGVTQSDLAIWQAHLDPHQNRQSRIVVLNKIDSLWDPLKSEADLEAEIEKQQQTCAEVLGLSPTQIFPVSAQKGLLAKIHGDAPLLARSRLAELEAELSEKLIPAKQDIIRHDVAENFDHVYAQTLNLIESRLDHLSTQMEELQRLNGKNRAILEFSMNKARQEQESFKAGLEGYRAARSVLARLSGQLQYRLGSAALEVLIRATKKTMGKVAFSRQLSGAIRTFFSSARENLVQGDSLLAEIHAMMEVAYRHMVKEYGARLPQIPPFALSRYNHELQRLEDWCDTNLNTIASLLTQERHTITQKFFGEAVQQTQKLFVRALRDAEVWLKKILAPLEGQIVEKESHLERRMENIRRVLEADGSLSERISELETAEKRLRQHLLKMEKFQWTLAAALQASSAQQV